MLPYRDRVERQYRLGPNGFAPMSSELGKDVVCHEFDSHGS